MYNLRLRPKDYNKIKKLLLFIISIIFLSKIFNIKVIFLLIPFLILIAILVLRKKIFIYIFKNKLMKFNSVEDKLFYLIKFNFIPSKIHIELIYSNLLSFYNQFDYKEIILSIDKSMNLLLTKNYRLYNIFYSASIKFLLNNNLKESINFGNKYYKINDNRYVDNSSLELLVRAFDKSGMISKANKFLKLLKKDTWWYKNNASKLKINNQIFKSGMNYGEKINHNIKFDKNTILYHTSHSLPYVSSGYALRSHWLIKNIMNFKWNINVCNRVGFPSDRYDFNNKLIITSEENIEGVHYIYAPDRIGINIMNMQEYHEYSVNTILEQCKKIKPALIHAASNHTCGLAATDAAKRLGLPSIYEVRGLWHYTRASKETYYRNSEHFQMIHNLEIQAARNATHVFAITEGVKDKLIEGGVNNNKISILPNGVDANKFIQLTKDKDLINKFKLNDFIIIGYIGAFVDYEGLDYLIKSIRNLIDQKIEKFKVVIVGDGNIAADLKSLINELKISDKIILTGKVPHEDVNKYYSIMDILVYARKGFEVCELVSPLKPLEAMAMNKAIIVSDVKALKEMVIDNETGLIHQKDNIDDLTEKLIRLIQSEKLRNRLSNNAYNWVLENRTWESISNIVNKKYIELIGK
tara:strand:+ start:1967 stop:3877 length:1911 start_codon:yes stop_codon:yes gene_type:complete